MIEHSKFKSDAMKNQLALCMDRSLVWSLNTSWTRLRKVHMHLQRLSTSLACMYSLVQHIGFQRWFSKANIKSLIDTDSVSVII
jgi:hypothetical protein